MISVLVTGSRTWENYDALEQAMDQIGRNSGVGMRRDGEGHAIDWDWAEEGGLTIIHGACPDGADQLAERYHQDHGTGIRRLPALWRKPDGDLDRSAGFKRNADMVALRPNAVIGLVDRCAKPAHQSSPHGSHGAIHTLNLAMNARLPMMVFYKGFHLDEPLLQWAGAVTEL